MISPNLLRYAPWQFRDFVRERGLALLLIGLVVGFTTVAPIRSVRGSLDFNTARSLLLMLLPQVVLLNAFVALSGLVSNDRKLGYFRFLFSKPVSIPAYYAQLFAVYLVGFVAVFAILLGVFTIATLPSSADSVMAGPVSPAGPLAYAALAFLSFGGIAFFISTLVRHDWPVLAGVLLGSSFLNAMWRYEGGWKRTVLNLLPPLHRLDAMLSDFVLRGTVDVKTILWLLGYSTIFFIAGLYVLRRRRFG